MSWQLQLFFKNDVKISWEFWKMLKFFFWAYFLFIFRNVSEIIKSCGLIRLLFFLSMFVTFGYTLNLWFLISVRTALSCHIFITRCTFLSNIIWWYILSRNCLGLEFYATLEPCLYLVYNSKFYQALGKNKELKVSQAELLPEMVG